MRNNHHKTPPSLATVTVTYNPDIAQLNAQLQALPQGCLKVLVDNSSTSSDEILSLRDSYPNLAVVMNKENTGLAAGINQGVSKIRELAPDTRLLLLLDQDSEPLPGSIKAMTDACLSLEAAGLNPGAVGPLMKDVKTGLTHGFHQCDWWHWYRIYPRSDDREPLQCAGINGSGTLMPLSVHEKLGGFNEAFFIDHVDTDWSFRMLDAGYTLWGIPNAEFLHRMGEDSLKFWFLGWRIWPYRSPVRHFYLFRNTILLIEAKHSYRVWKFWAVVKLFLTFLVHLFVDRKRWQQTRSMWAGIKAGIWFKHHKNVYPDNLDSGR
jgi:rhamnosyltransferase